MALENKVKLQHLNTASFIPTKVPQGQMTPSVCWLVLGAVPWGDYGLTISHEFPLSGLSRVSLVRGLCVQRACRTRREPQRCCLLAFLVFSLWLILFFLRAAEDWEVGPSREMNLCILDLRCHL